MLFLSTHIPSTMPAAKASKKNVADFEKELAEAKKIIGMDLSSHIWAATC